MSRPTLRFALLGVLAIALLATAGAASPQPSPICGFCSTDFENTAEQHGVNATVVESTVVVQVHEDGAATWTVRNRLGQGAAAFREDPALLERVAREMTEFSPGVTEDPSFQSAEVDGETVVLTYHDAGAAERHAGKLVVDYLHHDGRNQWYIVDADEFTIRGPPGTTVTNDPASGTVDGRSVTWRGTTEEPIYEAPTLEAYPYVVFGDDGSALASAGTTAALASATAPLVVGRATSFVPFQSGLFAVMLGLVGWLVRGWGPSVYPRKVGLVLVALGASGGVAAAAVYGPGSVPGPAVFAVLLGGLVVHPRSRRHLRTPRRQALAAAAALVLTWAVLAMVYAGVETYNVAGGSAVTSTALALPFAAMVPLGGAIDGDRRRVVPWGGVALLAFVAMVVSFADLAGPLSGLGGGILIIGSGLAAFAIPVVGAVVLLLGRALSDVGHTEDAPARRIDDVGGSA